MDNNVIISSIIATLSVAIITGLFTIVIKYVRELKSWRKNTIKDIKAILDGDGNFYRLIKSANFIPTHGQDEGPHNSDKIIISDNRYPLVDKLLNDYIFIKDHSGKKRFAILGGSGMGKSTFSISFLTTYVNKYTFKKSPYPVYFFYLGKENVINEIKELNNKGVDKDSIIFLEALDENVEATKDPKSFLTKLEAVTIDFYFVLFTCRTQFFPNEGEEPLFISVPVNTGNKKPIKYKKIYISPFSEDETQTFLENKYTLGSIKCQQAIRITQNSNDLMSRPMILSFMDDLLGIENPEKLTTVEIYLKIIDNWLDREIKNNVTGLNQISKEDLFVFSKKLAFKIYRNWITKSEISLSNKEYETFLNETGYEHNPYSFGGRSLINRRSDGAIKFSHKSFLEFFVAIISFENPGVPFNPIGIEMAIKFAKEIYGNYLNGKYAEFVDFFKPDFILYNNFTDNTIANYFDKFKIITDDHSKKKRNNRNSLIRDISNLRLELLRRLPSQNISCVSMVASLTLATLKAVSSGDNILASRLKSKSLEGEPLLMASEIVNDLQDCLLNPDKIFGLIPAITKKYKDSVNWLNSCKTLVGDFFNMDAFKVETVIYPYLLEYDDTIFDNVTKGKFISMSYGMSKDEDIFKSINTIKGRKRGLDYIALYRNFDTIEENVEFIVNLQNKITNKPTHIMLISYYKNGCVCYLINEHTKDYTHQEITKCINNMLI